MLLLGQQKSVFISSKFEDYVAPKEFYCFTDVQIPMVATGLHKNIHFSSLMLVFDSRP